MSEAESFLYGVLPSSPKELFKSGEGFYRSRYLLRELGNPQEEFKSVHIAGTSGKGSVSYYTSAVLKEHGFDIGTHVSPHVYDVRERCMTNLGYPGEKYYLKTLSSIVPVINEMDKKDTGRPTYFEVTVAQAMLMFAERKVDYAVIETGLGGRYDTTNTIERSDKLAVITPIDLDHTEVLGKTPRQIAYQKAGILPVGGDAITVNQNYAGAQAAIEKVAKQRATKMTSISPLINVHNVSVSIEGVYFDYSDGDVHIEGIKLPTIALYQLENAALAISAVKKLAARDGFSINPKKVASALENCAIPGRCEFRNIQGRTVMLDSAHNPQKMQALADSITNLGLNEKPFWLVGMKKEKDIDSMLGIIDGQADHVVCTTFFKDAASEHLRNFSENAGILARKLKLKGAEAIAVDGPSDALNEAIRRSKPDQLVVVAGSIYLLGDLADKKLLG